MSEAPIAPPILPHGFDSHTVAAGGIHVPPRRPRGPASWRLALVGTAFAAAFVMVGGALVLNAAPQTVSPAIAGGMTESGSREFSPRASIVDRNGEILAYSLPFSSLYANPQEVRDPEAVAAELVQALPELKATEVAATLANKGREFAYVARHLTPSQHSAVLNLGIPGLYFRKEYRRIYPRGRLASNTLGVVSEDHRSGLSGVEAFFDSDLANSPDLPLALSIDVRVQNVVREELQKAIDRFSGIGGIGLMMDVRTGEVLASVSLPDFNPNDFSTITSETQTNKVVGGRYELGSMFKLVTAAAALDYHVATERTMFDATKPLVAYGHRISDFRGEHRWLNMPEVLIHSSNIGAARMGALIGAPRMAQFFDRLGLLQKASIELEESAAPIAPHHWQEINAMTTAFGHGFSVTPIQFASAIGAVANGGVLRRPTLLRVAGDADTAGARVLSEDTSARVRRMMRAVVVQGSGKAANSPYYKVGGKTGTALKAISGGYSTDKRLSSFIGVFPIESPRYVVLVSVDEPKGRKDTLGFATGGWVSAPAVREIVERVAPMLGVPQSEPEKPKQPSLIHTVAVRVPQ
jgi:cell division protein FtsI (penicillin-binding protein 3)